MSRSAQLTASYDGIAEVSVPFLVERIAARHPARLAAVDESGALTYQELTQAADQVAGILIDHGAGQGDLVALALSRSAGYLAAMLGVLRAGAAYLPIDPDEPAVRTRAALAGLNVRLLLTDGAARFGLGLPQVVTPPVHQPGPSARPAGPPGRRGGARPCYVMFTSGTTGPPKAVVIPHRAVTTLAWRPRFASLAPGTVTLAVAPLHFDAATFEIWGGLCNGATVVVAPRSVLGAGELRELIQRHQVSVLHLTAGLFRVLADELPDCFAGLRWLLTGGDVVSAGHVRVVAERFPRLHIVACYGPTEGTAFTSAATVTSALAGPVPLGVPLPGRRMEVLDDMLRPVPAGAEGELYIAGDGLALGYLGPGQPAAETAARFIPDPRPQLPGDRLYRTGDRARRRPDGAFEFLGRTDSQVKIRGVRVEPGEVEAALAEHPGVTDAVVLPRGPAGEAVLVAYLTVKPDRRPDDRVLREFLGSRLPAAMIPAAFVTVDKFPVTAQGKVDRAALARIGPVSGDRRAPAQDPDGDLVLRTWRDCLDPELGWDENFFERGGHSLMALRIATRLEIALARRVPLRAIFEHPTARALARWLAEEEGMEGAAPADAGTPAMGPARQTAEFTADLDAASEQEIAVIARLLAAGATAASEATGPAERGP